MADTRPEELSEGKFILFTQPENEQPQILFGHGNHLHFDILADFEMIPPKRESFTMHGGGFFKVYNSSLIFSGESQSFGRYSRDKLLEATNDLSKEYEIVTN